MSRSLLVLPDDSAQPIVDAIDAAKESLRIKMFAFSHPELLDAVIRAHKRGVSVRIMLNPGRRNGEEDNTETKKHLTHAGIEVTDSNPAFDLTHEKSMVVDSKTAFIKSLNWQTRNFTETRDFAVITAHGDEVKEVLECFEADWSRRDFQCRDDSSLIWCVGNGRARLGRFIDEVKHSLFVQNERYQDAVIIEHLVRARLRGVKLHVMARPPHKLSEDKLVEGVSGLRILEDVGAKIHKLTHTKLHAKVLLADHERAIIGSINLSPGSFDSRRELAIEVRDANVVNRLDQVIRQDWNSSRALDLSDEGLLSELEKHDLDPEDRLGIPHHSQGKQ